MHLQRRAVSVDHSHIGAVGVEVDELIGEVAEALMVIAGDAHVVFEIGEATGAAVEALGEVGHGERIRRLKSTGESPEAWPILS